MKTALLSLAFILGLSSPCFAEYKPRCDFENEKVSKITRIVKFPQYGIQMEIPENLRAMLRNDGIVEILNNSTYRILQCPLKDRIGRGYTSYQIYKAEKQYMKTVPLGQGLFFVVRTYRMGLDETIYYDMAIRVQTSIGLVDVAIVEDNSITKEDAKEMAIRYIELAKMISLME